LFFNALDRVSTLVPTLVPTLGAGWGIDARRRLTGQNGRVPNFPVHHAATPRPSIAPGW